MFSRRLSVTNDVRVQRSIQNKRIALVIENHLPKIKKKLRMFDQFIIIGAPPSFEETKLEPVILSSYPKVYETLRPESEVQMLLSFSFPNGISKIRPDTTGKRTILIEFVFVLKEEAETLYGICVHFRGNDKLFFATEQNLEYPFCFCLLTATPFFSAHFTFLTYFTLYMVQRIESIPHTNPTENEQIIPPLNDKIFAHLVEDPTYPEIAVFPGLKATELFLNELAFYQSLPTKSTDQTTYPMIPLAPKIDLYLPLHLTKNQCFAYSSFHALFNTFKISEIVTIYTAILLEMRVVFVSKKFLHILSMSIFAIISLFKPFKLKSAILLPILPSNPNFNQILNLPVPYVIGTTSLTGDADLVVDIDSFKLISNSKIPQIPQRSELISKLMKILTENASKCTIPQYDVDSDKPINNENEFLKFIDNYDHYNFPYIYISLTKLAYIFPPKIIDSIIDVFANHIAPFLRETVSGCFVTDKTDEDKPVTVVNNDLFLCQLPDCDREFYEKFIQTNNWETFCDKLSDERNNAYKSNNG